MFSDKKTIELLNSMAASEFEKKRGGNLLQSKMADKTKHYNEIERHFKSRRAYGYWAKLDYFLEKSVFRAGLQIQCPNCSYYNWYDLDSVSYSLTCTRCLENFEFKQTPEHLKRLDWHYRVIGPFATPEFRAGRVFCSTDTQTSASRVP